MAMSVRSGGAAPRPDPRARSQSPHSSHASVGEGSFHSRRSGSGHSGFHKSYQGSQAWWSVSEFMRPGLTHQSVGLTLHDHDDTWDLSDSLADLFREVNRRDQHAGTSTSNGNASAGQLQGHHGQSSRDRDDNKHVDVARWIADDTSHGFIRVFSPDSDENSRLFPCTLSTAAQKICMQMGIPNNSLHVQLNGDIIRRMEPFDCPLAVQNEYLASIGYTNLRRIQEEGPKEELAYLVKFYSGKPVSDSTYSRNQLSSYVYVRKGKLLHQWVRRLCVISGTRLLIYRDKGAKPTVVQLAKGSVEEVQIKGQTNVLKLTSTLQGERSLYLSFVSQSDYNKWLKKCKKATSKLPTKADLSSCHLEFLPETVFINEDLQILVLRHNVLRERPIEEDIYTIGWLDDLPRFSSLRSLNLADNDLRVFPLALCLIKTLVELNLASNKLEEVPPQIAELTSLQVLHLHNNQLSSLPDEVSNMRNLAVVVLAFNHFAAIPSVLLQSQHATFQVDSLIMAGNQVSRLPTDLLMYMNHIKKVDLRMNKLQLLPTETAKFQSLEHVTHIDIRDNQVIDLDIRAIRCLEYLNCDRNGMKSLQVNGTSLKNLFASYNNLETLSVSPKPEWLVSMEISHNKLADLPSWVGDCFFLVRLDVSHNRLKALSEKLFTDARKLKILKANHNQIGALPGSVQNCIIEELHLEHNEIRSLSPELFIQANKLRYLNMTRNKLCDLPAPNHNDSFNKLQELYLSFNNLGNSAMAKVCCFPRLRVLLLAANKISVIEERDLEKLEQLQELNISGNLLTYLPSCLGRHPHLEVLRANCNLLQELPCFKNSSALKVLEVSSNHLRNVSMSNLMTSQVNLLDISGNPNLAVSSHDLEGVKKSKRLCMVDMRGQNWSLQDLRTVDEATDSRPWLSGLSQTSGIRNKLSVMVVNKPSVGESGDAVFAVIDGGRNDEVAKKLSDNLLATLQAEQTHKHTHDDYMKYTMLTAHKQLKALGQKLGSAAALVHITRRRELGQTSSRGDKKRGDSVSRGDWVLRVANVGDTEVVLCHHGRPVVLTRQFDVTEDAEECQRVVNSGGIVTEDGRVNGVTFNTRLLGSSYLFPYVIPEPHTSSRTLGHSDRFLIVASQGLWKVVTHEEAVKEIKDISDPVVAAKRLQDLAQGYGSRENIAVMVVRLMLSETERFRVQESLHAQRESQKELLRVLSQRTDLLELRDGVPQTPELRDVVFDRAGRAKKPKASSLHGSMRDSEGSVAKEQKKAEEKQHTDAKQQEKTRSTSKLYRKKDEPHTWESVLSRRLAEEVKSKELKHAFLAPDEDEDADNVIDFSSEQPNWRAETKRRHGDGVEGWSQAMQERLAMEVKQREIQRELLGKNDGVSANEDDVDGEGSNWSTLTKEPKNGVFPKKIMLPGKNPLVQSQSNPPDVVRSHKTKPPPPPPPQSPSPPPPPRPPPMTKPPKSNTQPESSRHNRPPPPVPCTSPSKSTTPQLPPPPPPPPFYTGKGASLDSLVSLDDFKKEVVRSPNIDRDAILFHQMQMARAHSGSNASLTSIQSDPLYASVREVFQPVPPTSSRSIEVLVHSSERHIFYEEDDSETPHIIMGDDPDCYRSDSTLMGVDEEVDGLDVTIENLYDRVRMRDEDTGSKSNMWNGESEEDKDSDTDTLVGDEELVDGPEMNVDGPEINGLGEGEDEEGEDEEEEVLYATVDKSRKHNPEAGALPITGADGSDSHEQGVPGPSSARAPPVHADHGGLSTSAGERTDLDLSSTGRNQPAQKHSTNVPCNRDSPTYLTPYATTLPQSSSSPPPRPPPPIPTNPTSPSVSKSQTYTVPANIGFPTVSKSSTSSQSNPNTSTTSKSQAPPLPTTNTPIPTTSHHPTYPSFSKPQAPASLANPPHPSSSNPNTQTNPLNAPTHSKPQPLAPNSTVLNTLTHTRPSVPPPPPPPPPPPTPAVPLTNKAPMPWPLPQTPPPLPTTATETTMFGKRPSNQKSIIITYL